MRANIRFSAVQLWLGHRGHANVIYLVTYWSEERGLGVATFVFPDR